MNTPPMAIPFPFRVILGPILFLLNLLKPQLHFLILFSEFFNSGHKSLDLLSQGCRIWIGFQLNVEVDGNYVFKYESENVVPTDDAKLIKHDLVSRDERAQMNPNSHLDTCVGDKTASAGVVTDVMPATTFPMLKSERKRIM